MLAQDRRTLLSEHRKSLLIGDYDAARALLPKMRKSMRNPFSTDPIALAVDKLPQVRTSSAFKWAKKIKHFFTLKPSSNKPKEGASLIVESKNGAGCIFLSAIPVSDSNAEKLPSPFPGFAKFFAKGPGQNTNSKADVYWISLPLPTEIFSSFDDNPIKAAGAEAVIPFNRANETTFSKGNIQYAEVEPMWDHSACSAVTGKIFIRKDFTLIFDKAKELQDKGTNIVFNCAAGNARSASILSAYLMEKLEHSLSESTMLIAQKRPQTHGFASRNAHQKAFLVTYFLDKFTNDDAYRERYFNKPAETIAEDLFLCFTTDFKEADAYQANAFPGSKPYSDLPMEQLASLIIELKHSDKIPEKTRQEVITLLANKMNNIPPRKDKIKCETPSERQKEILSFLLPKSESKDTTSYQATITPTTKPQAASEMVAKTKPTPRRHSFHASMFGGGDISALEDADTKKKAVSDAPDQYKVG